jgi:hypothetical protein
MDRVTVLAVAAGVLMAVLVKLAPALSISTGICMVAFAVSFGAGGGIGGLIKSVASLLAGAIWTLLANMLVVAHESSLSEYRWALFGIIVLIVIVQSKVRLLSYIPGALCGVAMAAGAPSLRPYGLLVGLALVLGSVFAFGADAITGLVSKKAGVGAAAPLG